MDVLRRVQPQAVQMKLPNPISGVLRRIRAPARSCSPSKLMAVPQSVPCCSRKKERRTWSGNCRRAQVVVDDIKNHADTQSMRLIDKAPQIVRRPIDGHGRE